MREHPTAGQMQEDPKKEINKCTVRTGGVKLWEADREKMSVPTHIKFTHSQKCDWKSPVCPGYLSHNIIQPDCSAGDVT